MTLGGNREEYPGPANTLRPPELVILAGVLALCAVLSKLVCGLGVLAPGISRLAVGVGMVPRGEVGLIFAGVGAGLTLGGEPLLSRSVFTAIVLVVLVTTLLAPVGLRLVLDAPASSRGLEGTSEAGGEAAQ